ncbi:MAG: hypothetical protein KatS3mg006_1568 [Pyrinomonadaceae bacterium]|jgi:deoxyribodipyrimidine photolyase-related protein|nr:MAG: hypothetical protein KatS3mg006_1568 [Pyrinomonadaceae bacterium]
MTQKYRILRLILGDQLNPQHSWFRERNEKILYCMMEVRQETDYVRHHIQKIVGFFLAMRSFANLLRQKGHNVFYFTINDLNNRHSIPENLQWLIHKFKIQKFEYQMPDEWRLDQQIREFCNQIGIETKVYDTEHFLTTRNELAQFFKDKNQILMETFYRYMRKKHAILLDKNGKPEGGKWNFDKSNRKPLPEKFSFPPFWKATHDAKPILEEISKAGITTIGKPKDEFSLPINRSEALTQLEHFVRELLPNFGDYQDAMHDAEPFLFHSRLSFALNLKMLNPKEVVERVANAYYENPKLYKLNQVEGFIRQIIGWREYMRGIYWKEMPSYSKLNYFGHNRKLPSFYWTANTKMNCLKNAIQNSLENAYAHHIQRLMITGNFALLNLTSPDEVDE